MSKTYVSRAAAGAVLSATLMAGSLSLAATVASVGKLPAAAVTAAGARIAVIHHQLVPCPCSNPACQSGC